MRTSASCGRRRWTTLRGKGEGREFGLLHPLFDERADLQAPLDPKNVLKPGARARVLWHEELATILIRLDRRGEAAELLGLVGNFDLVHSDQRAEEREFRRRFDHCEILRRLRGDLPQTIAGHQCPTAFTPRQF